MSEVVKCCKLNNDMTVHLLTKSVERLDDVPSVAHFICNIIHNFAVTFEEIQIEAAKQKNPVHNNDLSMYIDTLVVKLFQVIARDDSEEENLRSEAYKAITELISFSADDKLALVLQVFDECIKKMTDCCDPNVPLDTNTRLNSLADVLPLLLASMGRLPITMLDFARCDILVAILIKILKIKGIF